MQFDRFYTAYVPRIRHELGDSPIDIINAYNAKYSLPKKCLWCGELKVGQELLHDNFVSNPKLLAAEYKELGNECADCKGNIRRVRYWDPSTGQATVEHRATFYALNTVISSPDVCNLILKFF